MVFALQPNTIPSSLGFIWGGRCGGERSGKEFSFIYSVQIETCTQAAHPFPRPCFTSASVRWCPQQKVVRVMDGVRQDGFKLPGLNLGLGSATALAPQIDAINKVLVTGNITQALGATFPSKVQQKHLQDEGAQNGARATRCILRGLLFHSLHSRAVDAEYSLTALMARTRRDATTASRFKRIWGSLPNKRKPENGIEQA